jgi:TPR repeat protein
LYDNGDNDYKETAMDFYNKSAKEHNSDAHTRLGMIYENGLLNQQQDNKKSLSHYKKAIEIDDNSEALNRVGLIHYKGNIVKQNYTIAVDSFEHAARLGNIDAHNNLGICFEFGKGADKNIEKALK